MRKTIEEGVPTGLSVGVGANYLPYSVVQYFSATFLAFTISLTVPNLALHLFIIISQKSTRTRTFLL